MFVVQETIDETLDWPVKVETPVSGGTSKTREFTGTFKRLSDEQKKELTETGDGSESDAEWVEKYLDRTMKIMTNWSGVVSTTKEPIPYTRENFKKVITAPSGLAVIHAITRAMNQIESGIKAKN